MPKATKSNPELERVELIVKLVIAKGFNCHVCSSTSFSYNGMGLMFCLECGITYHAEILQNIYT